jgi:hypothetical protein
MSAALKRAIIGYKPPSPDICYLEQLYLYKSILWLAILLNGLTLKMQALQFFKMMRTT